MKGNSSVSRSSIHPRLCVLAGKRQELYLKERMKQGLRRSVGGPATHDGGTIDENTELSAGTFALLRVSTASFRESNLSTQQLQHGGVENDRHSAKDCKRTQTKDISR
jgi:hypothetical protein